MSERLEKKKQRKFQDVRARNTVLEQINRDLMLENEDLVNELRRVRRELETLKGEL